MPHHFLEAGYFHEDTSWLLPNREDDAEQRSAGNHGYEVRR